MRMDRRQLLDLYFIDARARLIDIAAFLDRLERSEGAGDFRLVEFRRALKELGKPGADRARRVLMSLSDRTRAPIAKAPGKGACGAFKKKSK